MKDAQDAVRRPSQSDESVGLAHGWRERLVDHDLGAVAHECRVPPVGNDAKVEVGKRDQERAMEDTTSNAEPHQPHADQITHPSRCIRTSKAASLSDVYYIRHGC